MHLTCLSKSQVIYMLLKLYLKIFVYRKTSWTLCKKMYLQNKYLDSI